MYTSKIRREASFCDDLRYEVLVYVNVNFSYTAHIRTTLLGRHGNEKKDLLEHR